MENDSLFQLELLKRLDIIVRLLLESKGRTAREQITVLSDFGLSPSEIARVLGTTTNTVSAQLSQIRRKKSTKT